MTAAYTTQGSGRKKKVATRKKAKIATSSFETTGYIERGKKFLADLIKERVKNGEEIVCAQGIDTKILSKAFGIPNQYSTLALELYLTQKCFTEGFGKSTSDGIHGAFTFQKTDICRDGTKYAGEYKYDEETGKISGCPARAASIETFIKAVRTKAGVKGAAATRNHAEAMTIEDLKKLMDWSETQCSPAMLQKELKSLDELKKTEMHGLMRGFLASGFTLWTRNFELCGLQRRDVNLNCEGRAPHYFPFFTVHLENRKGWQSKQGYEGSLISNTYEIYSQPDNPETDMYHHLPVWISFLEHHLGRPLEPEDYIFPYFGPNGVAHPRREMTHDLIQSMLDQFAKGAGLNKNYTTHSPRRGGAQYRFMYAPIGKRWSLSMIRWWGGWAIGEHVDTLIKYLIDSLQSYEMGHGDALCPISTEADQSFMGEHVQVRPVTSIEFQRREELLQQRIDQKFDALMGALSIGRTHTTHNFGSNAGIPSSQSEPFPIMSCSDPKHSADQTASTRVVISTAQHSDSGTNTSRAPDLLPKSLPVRGVSIPDLGHGTDAWRRAIKQWEEPDAGTGLAALKDWPSEWYTGVMRPHMAAKRTIRKTIAAEYTRLHRKDREFLETYPEARKSVTALLFAIRRKTVKPRNSKNGTPEERAMIEFQLNQLVDEEAAA